MHKPTLQLVKGNQRHIDQRKPHKNKEKYSDETRGDKCQLYEASREHL